MNKKLRNPGNPIENLAIGIIIEVDGTPHIVAELNSGITELSRIYGGDIYQIGQFGSIIRIHFGRRILYGYVSRLRMKAEYEHERGISSELTSSARIIEADLFGEGEWSHKQSDKNSEWKLEFERGISTFPLPQQTAYLTPNSELAFIFGHGEEATINIGEHVGSGGVPCLADMNELLGKHTAVLGSTGAGKSGAVAAILHSLLAHGDAYQKWNPRIVILDPHNEYGDAFSSHKRLSTDEGTLSLPYWLLSFQETLSLLIGKTEFVATSQANIVKAALLDARQKGCAALGANVSEITVDSPIPYNWTDFIAHVENGKPPQASKQESYNSILQKLEILREDARLSFLMDDWDGTTDPFASIVAQFLGGDNDPLRITNGSDREHVKAILPDSLSGLTKMLSGLRRREAIFVGQAAMLPSRILIRHLEENQLPRSHDIDFGKGWQGDPISNAAINAIGKRWRVQRRETTG